MDGRMVGRTDRQQTNSHWNGLENKFLERIRQARIGVCQNRLKYIFESTWKIEIHLSFFLRGLFGGLWHCTSKSEKTQILVENLKKADTIPTAIIYLYLNIQIARWRRHHSRFLHDTVYNAFCQIKFWYQAFHVSVPYVSPCHSLSN